MSDGAAMIAFAKARLDEDEAAAQAAAVLWDDGNWTEVEADPYVHTQRHGPARTLREVEAKRAILALHEDWPLDEWPCQTVRHIIAVWSDHPDYQQDWKP